jgi:multiple sugar transport system ATP-binding protein
MGGLERLPIERGAVVETTGCETQVTARLGGQDFVCVFRERFGGRPGENIALSLDGGPPHFFDAESGWAIAGR